MTTATPMTPMTPTPSASNLTLQTSTPSSSTDNMLQLAAVDTFTPQIRIVQDAYNNFMRQHLQNDQDTPTTPQAQESTSANPSPAPITASSAMQKSKTGAYPQGWDDRYERCTQRANCSGTDASGRVFDTDTPAPIIEYLPIGGSAVGTQSSGVLPLDMDADDAAAASASMSAFAASLCSPACVNGVCTASGVCTCQWGWKDAACNVSSRTQVFHNLSTYCRRGRLFPGRTGLLHDHTRSDHVGGHARRTAVFVEQCTELCKSMQRGRAFFVLISAESINFSLIHVWRLRIRTV
ncbi:unnamed protein product [Sphagnum balticum]